MYDELTNLLPQAQKRAFRRLYFSRLIAVALFLGALFVLAQAILLTPTYLYANGEAKRQRAELEAANAAAQTSEEQEARARASLLNTTVASLARLSSAPQATAAVRAVLAVPRPGVSLTGFAFAAPSGSNTSSRMQVSGVAATRDSLRQYASALGALPFVTSADLPISAYAKEKDIPFTITLSGSLRP
jgi:hypothetical protein